VKLYTHTCSWASVPVSRPDDRDAVQISFTKRIISDLACLLIQISVFLIGRDISPCHHTHIWSGIRPASQAMAYVSVSWKLRVAAATYIYTSRSRIEKTRYFLTLHLTVCSLKEYRYVHYSSMFNRLKTKSRLLYLNLQSVPRCKHFSSRLYNPISLRSNWHRSVFFSDKYETHKYSVDGAYSC
jgi:hypothetical protein